MGKPVVFFLFLLLDDLPHSDLWQRWLADAPREEWRALVHCKDAAACRRKGIFSLPGFEEVKTVDTWYCHDLVTAMVQLLKYSIWGHSMQDHEHDKFVFISGSTLPVHPFHEVHETLTADSDSDFCIFPKEQWATARIDGTDVAMVKHHQWVILSREHARIMVDKWEPVDHRSVWQVWLKGGHWADKPRFVSPQHFHHPPSANWCTDEWAFFATIYGVVETRRGAAHHPGLGGGAIETFGMRPHDTQGRCRTYTFWDDGDGPEFARIAKQIRWDPSSSMSCYPRCSPRPASFSALSQQSMQTLRHSSFLFARKFEPTASIPSFDVIVIR
jgi:hypothetical protein